MRHGGFGGGHGGFGGGHGGFGGRGFVGGGFGRAGGVGFHGGWGRGPRVGIGHIGGGFHRPVGRFGWGLGWHRPFWGWGWYGRHAFYAPWRWPYHWGWFWPWAGVYTGAAVMAGAHPYQFPAIYCFSMIALMGLIALIATLVAIGTWAGSPFAIGALAVFGIALCCVCCAGASHNAQDEESDEGKGGDQKTTDPNAATSTAANQAGQPQPLQQITIVPSQQPSSFGTMYPGQQLQVQPQPQSNQPVYLLPANSGYQVGQQVYLQTAPGQPPQLFQIVGPSSSNSAPSPMVSSQPQQVVPQALGHHDEGVTFHQP